MSSVPGLYGVTLATYIRSYSVVLTPGVYGFDEAAKLVAGSPAAPTSAAAPAYCNNVRRSIVPRLPFVTSLLIAPPLKTARENGSMLRWPSLV